MWWRALALAFVLMTAPARASGRVTYFAFGRSPGNYIVYSVDKPGSGYVQNIYYFDDDGKLQKCTAIEYRADGTTVYTNLTAAKAWLFKL